MHHDPNVIWFFIGVIMILSVYFVPLWIALARNHKSKLGIGLANLFLGWTLVGWLFAFVWSVTARA
jgi:hypothetical protein